MSYSWGVGVGSARTEGLPIVRAVPEMPAMPAEARPHRPGDLHQLAIELAPMVDVWQRLLAQHVPDRAGRCTTCTKGGTGLPSQPWPCSIHAIADRAREAYAAECARQRPSA